MIKTALEKPLEKPLETVSPREWGLKFQRSPQEVLPTADGRRARGVRMVLTRLEVRAWYGLSRTLLHPSSPWESFRGHCCLPWLVRLALGEASTTKSLFPSKGSCFHAAVAERPLGKDLWDQRCQRGLEEAVLHLVTDGQQPLSSSLRAQVTLPKPSPLETWRSWNVGWWSAASAIGACRWTRQCPSTPSVALFPTARAEWRVSQVCIHRDVGETCQVQLVGWEAPFTKGMAQGGCTPQ